MTTNKKRYPIPPDRTLMEDIGATSFTLAEAIVELVANCIDARLYDGDKPIPVNVDVRVSQDEVSVRDDARGMTEEILVEAVRLGVKMDAINGNTRKRKGMYGLGLKTAAASIGRYWSVLTRPIDGDEDYFLEFDLAQYHRSPTKSVEDWQVEVETRPRTRHGPFGEQISGTIVTIKKIRDKNPQVGSVTQLLGDAYKPHIDSGDSIVVEGVAAKPIEPQFLPDSRIVFDEQVGDSKKWRVKGWVALDSRTHNDGKYGFNLYRENQLIETWDKSWFRAHLMTSRIVGEAHLDFMPVNFNKQGFTTQSEEWLATVKHMTEFLRPVVRASQDANRGRNDETKMKRAVQGMKKALKGAPPDIDPDLPDGAPSPSKPMVPETDTSAVTIDKIVIKGHEIYPSCIVEDWNSDVTPYDYTHADFDDGERTDVQTVLNSASRLYQSTSDTNILGILAVADCVTRYLVERRGVEPSKAREIRDRWIYSALPEAKATDEKGAKQ